MIVDTSLVDSCSVVKKISESGTLPAEISVYDIQLHIGRVQVRLGATAPWTEDCRKANAILRPEMERAQAASLARSKAFKEARRAVKHAKNLRRRENQARAAEENRIRAQKGGCHKKG